MSNTTISATGRRKTASAQVRLTAGSGKIVVYGRPYDEYFAVASQQGAVLKPLEVAQVRNQFDISVNAKGGGNAPAEDHVSAGSDSNDGDEDDE